MCKKAWVTLATNDTYSLGALVLAHSLKKVKTAHKFVVLITSGVTYAMRGALKSIFDVVQEVNVLDSSDVENLQLLARPELGITFTKLHCWRLTQYEKCVFLDADTLVLQNCDELFDREELSAAPDVGWPDCFNSGVFVYKPSEETYQKLIKFALDHGSFDGADQGLLNMFYSDWATNDGSKRLSFLYNLTSAAIYSYLPAFKWFGKGVKIIHFIGNAKPWLQPFNSETRTVSSDSTCSHLTNFLQYWWDLFCESVHPQLSPEMAGLANSLSQMKLEEPSPEQKAREDFLRRQEWEHGNIDYMGRDAFENILNKINQTLLEQTKTESVNVDTTSAVSQDSYTKTSESIFDLQEKSTTLISEDVSPSSTTPAAEASPAVPDIKPEQSVHKVKDPASITTEKPVSVKKSSGGKSVVEKSISSSQAAITEQSNIDKITEPPPSSQEAPETSSTEKQTIRESSAFCPISTSKIQHQSPTPVTEAPAVFIKPSPISQKQTSAESPVSCPTKKEDYPLSSVTGMSATFSKLAPVAQEQTSVESPACPKPISEKLVTSSSSTSAEIALLKQEHSKETTTTQTNAGSTPQSSAKSESSQKVALSRQSSGQENQGKPAQKSGGGKKK